MKLQVDYVNYDTNILKDLTCFNKIFHYTERFYVFLPNLSVGLQIGICF